MIKSRVLGKEWECFDGKKIVVVCINALPFSLTYLQPENFKIPREYIQTSKFLIFVKEKFPTESRTEYKTRCQPKSKFQEIIKN